MNMTKKLAFLGILAACAQQAQAYKHTIINNTNDAMDVLAEGIWNLNNAAVTIPANQTKDIEMGIYCTSGFTITDKEQASKDKPLGGVSFYFDQPYPNKCPGNTITLAIDRSDPEITTDQYGNVIEKTYLRIKANLDNVTAYTYYSSPKTEIKVQEKSGIYINR